MSSLLISLAVKSDVVPYKAEPELGPSEWRGAVIEERFTDLLVRGLQWSTRRAIKAILLVVDWMQKGVYSVYTLTSGFLRMYPDD